MSGINTNKVVMAGLAAGFVMNVIDFIVNSTLLSAQWTAAMTALNHAKGMESGAAVASFIISDFVLGLVAAFIYAAIRPRFGAGLRTGLIAGAIIWICSLTFAWPLQAMGLFPMGLIAMTMAGSIVSYLAGGATAGRLYSEA